MPSTPTVCPHTAVLCSLVVGREVEQKKNYSNMSTRHRATGQFYDSEGCGYCLIINNEDFSSCGLNIRQGSSRDASGIRDELENRNVTVKTINNCTAHQIHSSLTGLRNITGAMYRFLMIVILSHGFHGRIIGTDGIRIDVNDILEILSAASLPSFKNKPKILILHTCQEEEDDEGYNHDHFSMIEKHFLIALPTLPYRLAYRQPGKGTFYIQCFLQVLRERGDIEDLMSMLTIVNRDLQPAVEAVRQRYTQTSVVHSTLSDKVFLKSSQIISRDVYSLSGSSYCVVPSYSTPSRISHSRAMEMDTTNNQHQYRYSRGASQARSVLESVEEEAPRLHSENERTKSQASQNPEGHTKEEPEKRNECIHEQPQPVPAAVDTETAQEEYECNIVTLEAAPENKATTSDKQLEESNEGKIGTKQSLTNSVVEQPQLSQNKTETIEGSNSREESLSDEQRIDLSPTLLWDDVEEDKEEEKEELQHSTTETPSLIPMECNAQNNASQPATIMEEESDDDYVMVNLIPLRQREVQDWLELY